ncbi:zincin [Sistotremastrum niveocremeum HHB9708]|uniref:Zincin n=1 Tax=Sistotremastrum niveocremeum HHB9708 TaxID=1314777 RepID=A0A164TKS8_9AGAM|nr:zincin [Sistotremastrum niveocremeum HHB9708]
MGDEDIPICEFQLPEDESPAPEGTIMKMALERDYRWPHGSVLRIRFLNGTSDLHERVKKHAAEWLKYAWVFFHYVSEGDADIRIWFGGKGWSSKLGNTSRGPQNTPSMKLAMTSKTIDTEGRHILHEFGHALGCIHEHLRPDTGIIWNKPKVLAHYMNPPNNWPKEKVEHNLFQPYERSELISSKMDKKSIMIYAVRADFTKNGWSCGWNKTLSDTDKEFIGKMYPRPAAGWRESGRLETKDEPIRLKLTLTKTPDVVVGIRGIDAYSLSTQNSLNIAFSTSRSGGHTFLDMKPGTDTVLANGTASWVDLVNDKDFHHGEVKFAGKPAKGTKHTRKVTFPTAYRRTPQVMAFPTAVGMENEWRFNVYAADITSEGFTLVSEWWPSLLNITCTWISLPSNGLNYIDPFIASGQAMWGQIDFSQRNLKGVPGVFMAISQLHADASKGLRVRLRPHDVNTSSMWWFVDTWYGSDIKEVGGVIWARRF